MCHRLCVRRASIGCEHQQTASDPMSCDGPGGHWPFEELVMGLMIIVQGRWISLPRERVLL
jgi:hypothetical protein